jgi:ketosteroid isomerase-like protein
MSQENVEIVQKAFEVQDDPEKFFAMIDPHIVWINYASSLEPKPYVGHEGILKWRESLVTDIQNFRMELTEIIDAGGDQVVTVNKMSGAGRASGLATEREFASVVTLLNGKLVRVQGFETRGQALEAAGLEE